MNPPGRPFPLSRFLKWSAAWMLLPWTAGAVMFNRDTGDTQSKALATLPPFASRATTPGCSAVLIAPNALLSASHCTGYAASGNTTAYWNNQSRPGVFTKLGEDTMLIVTSTPFNNTTGNMTAPYAGSAEVNRLVWKVGIGQFGVLGPGATGVQADGTFRAMTNRIEVDNIPTPPPFVSTSWLVYDFDGPPSRPLGNRATTLYEGGTAPGDSGGPLYMFENGRWYVIGVTSGPDAGFYRDGRIRSDMARIESITGHRWARPVVPALAMRWIAQDLAATVPDGGPVNTWTRSGGAEAWTNLSGDGATGTATLAHNATPTGNAAVVFPGSARLGLPAAANPVANRTAFTVAMVVRVDGGHSGNETQWTDNTGLLDGAEAGTTNDWGLAVAASGRVGLGLGNPDTTRYSGPVISDGQWRVVVATWDGSEVSGDASGTNQNMNVYVDSAGSATRTQGPEFLNVARSAVNLTLGGSRLASRFFNGRIAELRLYEGALDDAAVEALIQELRGEHISAQPTLALTSPHSGRVAVPPGQGLVIDGTATGSPTLAIVQSDGPATATISTTTALPASVTFPMPGVYEFEVTASGGGTSVTRTVVAEALATPTAVPTLGESPVITPWTALNIGDAATAGNMTVGSSTASLTGAGLGFQEVSDSMRFAWKPLAGDGSITARVTGFVSNNNGRAFGGIMLRSSLRREAANVAATVISGGGVRFTRRTEAGAYTEPSVHTLRAPHWVRIERVGNTFTGYRSEDGVTWTQQGAPVTLASIPASATWGLAVTSRGGNATSRADFTNVTLEPAGSVSGNWTGADIGSPAVAGSNSGTGPSFTVNGGGTDIAGTSDQFRFLSRNLTGDGRITARVTAVERTDPSAKAGVMIRASSAADAPNVFVAVTPLSGILWQTRATAGATTSVDSTGTANFTAPHWLRLTRTGNTFRCFRSNDGVTWAQLGPAETIPDAPATMHAGFLIASLNNNGNSIVNLDNLAVVESGASSALPAVTITPGRNPSVANNFTLSANASGATAWTWQKISGPGTVTVRTQNTPTPQVAFSQAGTYVIRASAIAAGATTFVDQTVNASLDARWDFAADAEGWTANGATVGASGGNLTGNATSNDPFVMKTNASFVDGDLGRFVAVRFRGSASGTAQIFWGRTDAGGFSASRVVNAQYTTPNTWQTLVFSPSAHPDWTGQRITDLRFDPPGGTNSTFEVDWIAFSATDPSLPPPPADDDGDGVADNLETARYWNASPLSQIWQPDSAVWNTAPQGGGTSGVWNVGDDVFFDRAGSYTVTVSGQFQPGRVTLLGGNVTFDGSGSLNASRVLVQAGATLAGDGDRLFRTGSSTLMLNGIYSGGAAATSPDRSVILEGNGNITGGTLRVASGTFAGAFSGTAGLIKDTAGTLVLTGTNTSSGPVTILAGTLQIGDGGSAGLLGPAAVANSGNLVFQRSGNLTWAGSLSGTGRLIKSGNNTLTLTGNLSHTGGTTISGGVLQIGDGGTTGNLAGGAVANAGTIVFNRSNFSSSAANISGGLFGKLGTGTLVLFGNNSFGTGALTLGGGTQNVGYIRLAHPRALGNYSRIVLASTTSGVSGLEVTGGLSFPYAIETGGRNTPAGSTFLRNIADTNFWEGNITITGTGGTYDIESLAGTLVVTGTVTTGNFTATARSLQVRGAGDVTFAGSITESPTCAIGLSKSGTGTLRLNGVNSFTGAISLTGGALLVNGSVGPAIAVGTGATLGGTGTIGSATLGGTPASPATLSPGDGRPGVLSSSGTVTLGPGSRLSCEIGHLDPAAAEFDRLQASAIVVSATPSNPLVIAVSLDGTPALRNNPSVFPILSGSSLTGFDPAAVVLDTSAVPAAWGTWSVRQTGGSLELVLTPPPGYETWIANYPTIGNATPGADPDGDGSTNRDEWIFLTDPTDSASKFAPTLSATRLRFVAQVDRIYVVETSVDLRSWEIHATIPGSGSPVSIPLVDPPGPARFYRVRVSLPD